MRKYSGIQRIVSLVVAVILTLTTVMPSVCTVFASDAQETSKKIGWKELGVTQDTTYSTAGQTQTIGTPLTGTFSNIEFEGIINLGSSGGQVKLGIGGPKETKAFCIQGNANGSVYLKWNNNVLRYLNLSENDGPMLSQTLQDVDLILNLKMESVVTDDTYSSVELTITLKAMASEEQLYSETFAGKKIATADFMANACAYTRANTGETGTVTVKLPHTKIGWEELGVTQDTTYATAGQTQTVGTPLAGTFSRMEFEGIVNLGSSGGQVKMGFGGSSDTKAFYMQGNANGSVYLKWNNQVLRYLNLSENDGPMLSQTLQNVDLILNLKVIFASQDDTNSSGSIIVTLKDAKTENQLYSEAFLNKTITTADLVPRAWVYSRANTGENGTVTVKPVKKVGLTDFGITNDTMYTTTNEVQTIGTPLSGTYSWMEFEGIIHVEPTAQTKFGFGGSDGTKAFYIQVNTAGTGYLKWNNGTEEKVMRNLNVASEATSPKLTLHNVDLLINVKMGFTATDATNSTGNITVTIKDALTGTLLYTETFTDRTIATADLKARAWVYTRDNNSEKDGALIVKHSATEEKNIGWTDLGITKDTIYTTSAETQSIGTSLTGNYSNMEFEGMIHMASSGGQVRFGFGGNDITKAFCIQGNTNGSMYLKWNDGNPMGTINLPNTADGVSGNRVVTQELQDVDLLINIKMEFATKANDETKSIGNVTVTLTDVATGIEFYSEIFRNREIESTELVANACMYARTNENGALIVKFPTTKTEINWSDLGVIANTTYTTLGENQLIGSASTVNFSNLEFEGTIHVASGGRVEFGFGGQTSADALQMRALSNNRVCLQWNQDDKRYINYTEGTVNNVINAELTQDMDWLVNVKMTFATKANDETKSIGNVTVTLTNATTGVGMYATTLKNMEIDTEKLAANAWVWTENPGAMRVKLISTEPTSTIIVGGGDTNTTAFPVLVENGGTLPTGYTEDGKYILAWSIGDTKVTTYDNTQETPVAEFVDTKMLTVLQQNNGETPMDVRFIASLNTLKGYDSAGFVLANRPVDGELTIKNGRSVDLNVAYATLNENGIPVTAADTYQDAYSQYFIAFALADIPAGVTIYARAYVKIGDTVIYGNMASFNIDNLEP